MRTVISTVIIIEAAIIGAFHGSGMNELLGGATLFAVIAGFACTINAVEKGSKQ